MPTYKNIHSLIIVEIIIISFIVSTLSGIISSCCNNVKHIAVQEGIDDKSAMAIESLLIDLQDGVGCNDIINRNLCKKKGIEDKTIREVYCRLFEELSEWQSEHIEIQAYTGQSVAPADSLERILIVEFGNQRSVRVLLRNSSIESLISLSKGEIIIGWV